MVLTRVGVGQLFSEEWWDAVITKIITQKIVNSRRLFGFFCRDQCFCIITILPIFGEICPTKFCISYACFPCVVFSECLCIQTYNLDRYHLFQVSILNYLIFNLILTCLMKIPFLTCISEIVKYVKMFEFPGADWLYLLDINLHVSFKLES